MPPRRYSWEDYLYPPNERGRQVLRNKLGIRDPIDWYAAERKLTAIRAAELAAHPQLVARTFDVAHWKAIHYQLFQDFYEWAGQFRTVDIGKDAQGFLQVERLEQAAAHILGQVRVAGVFVGHDRVTVVEDLTLTLHALNLIHPFREGNGRTQRLFTEHIAHHAGWLIDWDSIDLTARTQVMVWASYGGLAPLHAALDAAIRPLLRGGAVDRTPPPAAQRRVPDRVAGVVAPDSPRDAGVPSVSAAAAAPVVDRGTLAEQMAEAGRRVAQLRRTPIGPSADPGAGAGEQRDAAEIGWSPDERRDLADWDDDRTR